MADIIERAKQRVRENEMRELSIAEERDPELIPNWEDYLDEVSDDSPQHSEQVECEDCDYVGTKRGLAIHRGLAH